MRVFPAGWTSATSTAPTPAAIWSVLPASMTVPGSPLPFTARAPNSFSSMLSNDVQAPGSGSKARMVRATDAASRPQSSRVMPRSILGAYVATLWSCGSGLAARPGAHGERLPQCCGTKLREALQQLTTGLVPCHLGFDAVQDRSGIQPRFEL